MNSVHEGDFIGEIALVTGQPRTASVQGDLSGPRARDHDRNFGKLLTSSPEIQRKILRAMAERLATATP